jgi:hypothetical protein
MENAAVLFDKMLHAAVKGIVVEGGLFFMDFQWRMTFLPIKIAGLSLYSALQVASYAFGF